MARCTDINGDPRFDWADADLYELKGPDGRKPLYGVIDSEAGYVAFTTDMDEARRIVLALDATEVP